MRMLKELLLAGMLVLAGQGSAHALTTHTFIGVAADGPYAGTFGFGTFTFDETLDLDTHSPGVPGFALEFTILGQTFTHVDDVDFDEYPQLEVFEGMPLSLDFLLVDGNPVDIVEGAVASIGLPDADLIPFDIFGDEFPDLPLRADFLTEVVIELHEVPVPEAATSVALLGIGLGALGWVRRSSKS